MRINHLSLTDFRNFSRLDMDVPGGSLLLVGGNAQGKTSLLEAIFYLATFTSFHASVDRQLINLLASHEPLVVARIVADFSRQYKNDPGNVISHHLEVRLIQESNEGNNGSRFRKEVLFDGVKQKVGEVVGKFNAVLFLPQMLRIIEGSPQERRRYLDLAFGQVYPQYTQHLSDYNHAVSQRNALLRQLSERGGDPEQLVFWDEQVALHGSQIIFTRIQAIQALEKHLARIHHELTRAGEVLRFSYQPAYDPMPDKPLQYTLPIETAVDRSGISLEEIKDGFGERLRDLRPQEIARGMTTIGPHRDELRFLCNGMDLGIYGSRGQARTAVLSTKLAEVIWIKDKTGQFPVLLLDEVLAELDPHRRSDLLARLLTSEQSLLTTTDLDLFSNDFVQNSQVWRIKGGQIIY